MNVGGYLTECVCNCKCRIHSYFDFCLDCQVFHMKSWKDWLRKDKENKEND